MMTTSSAMSTANEQRLDEFRRAFEAFVDKPHIAGTIDEFYGYKEEFSGLWVSGEEGNLVDGERAFDYWRIEKIQQMTENVVL